MMSPDDRLTYMANQIALNLAAHGREAAAAMLADHITAYWDPRTKALLLARGGTGLSPIALDALAMLSSPGNAAGTRAPIASDGSDAG